MIKAGPDFKSCFVEASLAFCIKCNFLGAPLHRIYGIIRIIKTLIKTLVIACLQVPLKLLSSDMC